MRPIDFIPSIHPDELDHLSGAAIAAVNLLMQTLVDSLTDDKQREMGQVLTGGGRIGVEIAVDATGTDRVTLIATEREGARHALATMTRDGKRIPRAMR